MLISKADLRIRTPWEGLPRAEGGNESESGRVGLQLWVGLIRIGLQMIRQWGAAGLNGGLRSGQEVIREARLLGGDPGSNEMLGGSPWIPLNSSF